MQERQVHKTRWLRLLLLGVLLLIGVPVGAFFLLYRQVRPMTVWELTGQCPPPSALMKDGGEGAYAFDVGKIDWTRPGDALVLVSGSGGPRIALVRLQDTTAPGAKGVPHILGVDEELGPDAFVTDVVDAQLVGVSFEQAPRFHEAGTWPVTVRLEDLSGNVGFVETDCTILGPVARISLEAGEPLPPLRAFLPNDTMSGRFVTDPATVDTAVPGVHMIQVEAEGQIYETALLVSDTVPPVCVFDDTVPFTLTGQALTPQSLVISASDATALTYGFDPQPDWQVRGYQTVTVAVTDAGGNTVTGAVTVLVSDLRPLVWEASRRSVTGSAVAARQQELDDSFTGQVLVARFVPKTVGCFDVNATVDEVPCIQRLFVVDTTAPRLAFPKKLSAYVDHPKTPEELLATAADETALTLSYVQEPDWSAEGPQPVVIEGVDAVGNRTELAGTVDLVRDTTPPKILGVTNQYVYVGEPVAYFAQASVTDNADRPEDVVLTVDNAAVDIFTPGAYTVTYTATDRAGNQAHKKARLTFLKPTVSEEKLMAKADEVLSRIVTDDMTQGQKAYAIYRYIYDNYTFGYASNKRDWKQEAWKGLTRQHGDCFTYCAAARLLLERIGAKVMFVSRKSSYRHYWLMVDLGTGWYHFDPLNDGPSRKYRCFMLTSQEVHELYPFFWRYDHRIYPDTPTVPFQRDW
jgi:hypothetical protein